MLNHFNFMQKGDEFLITNDFGRYAFISKQDFGKLVNDRLTSDDDCYKELCAKFFVYDKTREAFIADSVEYLRSMKSYMFTGTALHIFAVTNTCNMSCIYCQARNTSSNPNGFMSVETGIRAIEIAMSSPCKHLTFEFQGGEPLLNFDVVKAMVAHSREINVDKEIQYTIVTNLVALDDSILEYLISENISICTSLDGDANTHNINRTLVNGTGSYDAVKRGIEKVRNTGRQVGAIQTTSRHSLRYPREIVSAFVNLDVNGIFIRPLTPLGKARQYWGNIGYSPDEFLSFYKKALEYIIEINLNGQHFPEIHAGYFLKKILGGYSDNFMELRSPCGASIGQLSYYYDGSIYTCDEGRMLSEMGDFSFKLGDVHSNTYDQLMNSSTCKVTCAASVVESLAHCCDCAYQPYCGVCPVVNYAETQDIFPKSSSNFRCCIHTGILDILFDILRRDSEDVLDVFHRWIEVC